MKEDLVVSFSGGETSAYMLYWILNNWRDKYNIHIVFANTGEENEETLEFVYKVSYHFRIGITWLEAVFHKEHGKGTTHKVVNFETATRGAGLFQKMCEIYGIPNQSYPHCNRELKLAPIKSYIRELGLKDYYTAIGIRYDEVDRISTKRKELRLLYPLCENIQMTKQKINFWWSQQPFRLNLKGYEGNCKTCWKKSENKLIKIAQEHPEKFDSFKVLERLYENHTPPSRNECNPPYRFFRKNKSVDDILELAKTRKPVIHNDASDINFQMSLLDDESCDIYSMCGDD